MKSNMVGSFDRFQMRVEGKDEVMGHWCEVASLKVRLLLGLRYISSPGANLNRQLGKPMMNHEV